MLYAHTPERGIPINECAAATPVARVWASLRLLHHHQISHLDLRSSEITVDDGSARFGGFGSAEYGATDVQLQSDVAQLLVTTTAVYDANSAVAAAITHFGKDAVLTASGRLTRSAMPQRLRKSVCNSGAVISAARDEVMRQTGADQIQTETITRFTRNQVIQLVLLVGLVYVAYPYISAVPSFLSAIRAADWRWVLLGAAVSALTYVGAATALWACADRLVGFRNLVRLQFAYTFAATTTPAGVGGLALTARFLQKSGLSTVRATAAVAMQQAVQVITHIVLLIIFSAAAGASADLSHLVPSKTVLYLVAGLALGLVGVFLFVPVLRRWLRTTVPATTQGSHGRPRQTRPRTSAAGVGRPWLRHNNSRQCGRIVGQCPGFRRRCHVHRRHHRHHGRRNACLFGAHPGRRRRRRSGADRRARGVRAARGHRRASGAAVPADHLLGAGADRVAGDAVAASRGRDGRAATAASSTATNSVGTTAPRAGAPRASAPVANRMPGARSRRTRAHSSSQRTPRPVPPALRGPTFSENLVQT